MCQYQLRRRILSIVTLQETLSVCVFGPVPKSSPWSSDGHTMFRHTEQTNRPCAASNGLDGQHRTTIDCCPGLGELGAHHTVPRTSNRLKTMYKAIH
jgi:hypothetical protein